MQGFLNPDSSLDLVAHVIQVALTPVFLLSGIGTLLNVFNTRLSRVSDHREHVDELLRGELDDEQRAQLVSHRVRLRRFLRDARREAVLDAETQHQMVQDQAGLALEEYEGFRSEPARRHAAQQHINDSDMPPIHRATGSSDPFERVVERGFDVGLEKGIEQRGVFRRRVVRIAEFFRDRIELASGKGLRRRMEM